MNKFEDLKKSIEDGKENTITLALDDDTELEWKKVINEL